MYVIDLMASYSWHVVHILCVCYVLLSDGFKYGESFDVTRGKADSFPNPDCDSAGCPNICARYRAKCVQNEGGVCTRCECGLEGNYQSYIGNGKGDGGCLTNAQVIPASVPKVNMMIATRDIASKDHHKTCLKVDPAFALDNNCLNRKDASTLWIYTREKQFMNLKRLECLEKTDTEPVRAVRCKLDSVFQEWNCQNGLLNQKLGVNKTEHLQYSGRTIQLFAYNGFAKLGRSLCAKPIEYQGCYRFNDGSYMRSFSFSDGCGNNCHQTHKVLAPIFEENTKCVLAWENSSFLANDQTWKPLAGQNNSGDFNVSNAVTDSRGVLLKVHYSAAKRWAGTILQLQVRCSSKNGSEQHCVLLKFHGNYSDNQRTKTKPLNYQSSTPTSKSKSESCSYKMSTIALAVAVAILVLLLTFFAIMLCRRDKINSGLKVKQNSEPNLPLAENEGDQLSYSNA